MEELDIPGALERLRPYGLGPIERVLAGHTGTVQLLLSLLFNEPVDVVLIGQREIESRHEIQREVSLKLRHRETEVCRAISSIDLERNSQVVLQYIREGRLGLGQIAVTCNVPIKRTINTIDVTEDQISREYTMEGLEPGRLFIHLHFEITEMFPREMFLKEGFSV